MKKIYFVAAIAASMLAFTACSNDEDASKRGEESTEQILVVQVASAGDGLTTRAGRPLYSSEAAQDIDNVKIIVYKDGKVAYEKNLADWKTISKAYTTGGHGLQYTLTLKGADKLAAGDYKVLAVGYTGNGDYTYNPALTGLTKEASYTAPITATVKSEKEVEEVFAGEVALTVPTDNDQAFNTPVTLHRQVAGGFGYFKNIPAAVDGNAAATLRLVASAKNTAVKFENFNSSFTETSNAVQYIVNGTTPAVAEEGIKFSDGSTQGYVVYSLDLKTWFTEGDKNNDGVLNGDDTWANSIDALHIVKGSVFAGKFIIPFGYVDGKNTMELQLLSDAGAIIKHWTVKVPAVAPTNPNASQVTDQSASVYNIVRNHMYNIGVKVANPADPTTPGETPDVEQPEDLSKGQDLILKVNDNWELIHQMELE